MKVPILIKFKHVEDGLSHLVMAETLEDIPFDPRRLLWVYGFSETKRRKTKATRKGEQVFVAVHGAFSVKAMWFIDGSEWTSEFRLEDPATAVYMPPCVWRELYDFTEDAICLVICSNRHDEDDHIRNYAIFEEECG